MRLKKGKGLFHKYIENEYYVKVAVLLGRIAIHVLQLLTVNNSIGIDLKGHFLNKLKFVIQNKIRNQTHSILFPNRIVQSGG